jgi:nicotinamidase-related amidase
MEKTRSRDTLPGRKETALVVIDVQQGLFNRPTPIYKAEALLENIALLVHRARVEKVPVIFVQHSNDTILVEGTPGWQFHPRIQPMAGETIVHKLRGNAFEGTTLGEILRSRNVTTLVMTGLVTHGCVKSTCLGALELGYRVILVQDGHSNLSVDAPKQISKWNKILKAKKAELMAAAEVEF